MQIAANPKECRVEIRLQNDSDEASFVYDLIQSGRLLVENKDFLPLPFRGQFLFKLPARPRPIPVQVGRFEATGEEVLAGNAGLTLLVSTVRGTEGLLAELESALRDLPPASEEEFKADGSSSHQDEHARVRKLGHAQKIIYATRAGQTGRAILMQQPNPLLLLYLCKNPLITLPEIVQIARMPSIDALVAEHVVKMLRANPQWAVSEELKLALCTNAKTPGGTALSLLKGLSSRSLRQVCKKGELRGPIKQAAIRILTERRD